jgi:hypothetical protein
MTRLLNAIQVFGVIMLFTSIRFILSRAWFAAFAGIAVSLCIVAAAGAGLNAVARKSATKGIPIPGRWPGVFRPAATARPTPRLQSGLNNVEVWYYLQDGVSVGPISRPDIESMVWAGTVRADTLVWAGSGDWVAAGNSTLAPLFMARGIPVPPPPVPVQSWDFLPTNKRARTVILVTSALFGAYAIYSGMQRIRHEKGPRVSNAQINFQGCRGVSSDAVQCAYQNTGSVKRRLCMDVVVTCSDGRHVAATCSDDMEPGETSTKQFSGFSPAISAASTCSNIAYEYMKTKG